MAKIYMRSTMKRAGRRDLTLTTALEKIIDELLAGEFLKQLEQYRAGKETMLGFFVV